MGCFNNSPLDHHDIPWKPWDDVRLAGDVEKVAEVQGFVQGFVGREVERCGQNMSKRLGDSTSTNLWFLDDHAGARGDP